MILYTYFRSSCSWRVRIGLAYKGIGYDSVPVHLLKDGGQQHRLEFLELNPLSQVPVLELPGALGPQYLTQSLAILEYLEETYPDPPLLPREVWPRAQARRLAEIINSGMQPFQNTGMQRVLTEHGIDPAPVVRGFLQRGFKALEFIAKGTSKTYLVGDTPSIADVCLVPQFYQARRLSVDLSEYPTLVAVEQACMQLPAFQQAVPERQPDYEP